MIVTNVTANNPGVVITPGTGQTLLFVVFLEQLQEFDNNNKEVYSIFTQGMNFSLKVLFYYYYLFFGDF